MAKTAMTCNSAEPSSIFPTFILASAAAACGDGCEHDHGRPDDALEQDAPPVPDQAREGVRQHLCRRHGAEGCLEHLRDLRVGEAKQHDLALDLIRLHVSSDYVDDAHLGECTRIII